MRAQTPYFAPRTSAKRRRTQTARDESRSATISSPRAEDLSRVGVAAGLVRRAAHALQLVADGTGDDNVAADTSSEAVEAGLERARVALAAACNRPPVVVHNPFARERVLRAFGEEWIVPPGATFLVVRANHAVPCAARPSG